MTPSAGAMANRRFLVLVLIAAGILSFLYVGWSRSSESVIAYSKTPIHHVTVETDTLKGPAIMPALGNETLK